MSCALPRGCLGCAVTVLTLRSDQAEKACRASAPARACAAHGERRHHAAAGPAARVQGEARRVCVRRPPRCTRLTRPCSQGLPVEVDADQVLCQIRQPAGGAALPARTQTVIPPGALGSCATGPSTLTFPTTASQSSTRTSACSPTRTTCVRAAPRSARTGRGLLVAFAGVCGAPSGPRVDARGDGQAHRAVPAL